MKNKLFWPIVLISIVIIVESIMLLSSDKKTQKVEQENKVEIPRIEEVKKEEILSFEFVQEKEGKAILVMRVKKEIAIDAIDLYIGYRGVKIGEVKNLDELTKPTFFKVSQEKSLIVFNYLISESEGLKLKSGEEVKVAEINYTLKKDEKAEFLIDLKTQVVENGSAKVLPFSSQSLIINSTL